MANAKYDAGLQAINEASATWEGDTIQLRLVPSTYVFDATHATMADVGAGIGADATVSGKSVVLDAVNHFSFWKSTVTPSFGVIAAGSTIGGVVAYKFVTNDSDSIPLFYYDTNNLATSGVEITAIWPVDVLGGAAKLS